MNLLSKTQTEQHLLRLEKFTVKTNQLISATISNINNGYSYLWNLPDVELQDVLQNLLDNGKLVQLFENHYLAATSLNAIQDGTGASGGRALAIAGREFTVTDGVVAVIPLPEPEPEHQILPEE